MKKQPALVIALGAALVVAGAAGSAIVVNKGIGGVDLGMSQAAVRAKLGAPAKVVHAKNDFGPYTEFRYRRGLVVDFQQNGGVTSVTTTSSRERTKNGAGVGSTKAQVQAKVPGIRCEGTKFLHCHVGKLLPGKVVTDFAFRKGVVTSVVVGIVLD